MAQIVWTRRAVTDLRHIFDFIALDSRFYALRFTSKIIEAVEQLSMYPLSGRVVPEKNDPAVRELIVGNYRIFYRIMRQQVTILRIHHSARKITS
jgi:addiction module RelE/StbE family toxin